jgi:AraC family transcriptional regulator of adaptative response/methylated-DNA-[protein]-cysteine methyltransferase
MSPAWGGLTQFDGKKRVAARVPSGQDRHMTQSNDLPYRSPAQLVAEACAANHVALLIPCHRVIRSDGSLGGYRWGAARKKALLARERPA